MLFRSPELVGARPREAVFYPMTDGVAEAASPQRVGTTSDGLVIESTTGWKMKTAEKQLQNAEKKAAGHVMGSKDDENILNDEPDDELEKVKPSEELPILYLFSTQDLNDQEKSRWKNFDFSSIDFVCNDEGHVAFYGDLYKNKTEELMKKILKTNRKRSKVTHRVLTLIQKNKKSTN